MRLVVLVGSGLSIPAGYPSTPRLTEVVMSGDAVFRHTDSAYYLRGPGDPRGQPEIVRVVALLRRVERVVADYYRPRRDRPVNYEDLAYVVGQIEDSLGGDLDNPALGPLHDVLRADIEGILEQGGQGEDERWSVADLTRETRNYVADVVWRSLQEERAATHLGPFLDLLRDERIKDVSVFTLNHDTLLERTFRTTGLRFACGFGEPVNDVRYWEPEQFETSGVNRRLVKLHGSVDWFLLRPAGGDFQDDRVAQVSGDHQHTRDASGRLQDPVEGRPLLLVGTHNKARGYLNPPFYDAHIEFYRRLNRERADVLLAIGYGGQDKGINDRIVEWMESDPSRRLVMVNRTEGVLEQARGALRGLERGQFHGPRGFPRWREQGRFELIARPVENVSAADYVKAIGPQLSVRPARHA